MLEFRADSGDGGQVRAVKSLQIRVRPQARIAIEYTKVIVARKSLINHERFMGMRHIVVVDDDEITAYAYARYLKHSGYHVSVAHQTKDALLIAEKIEIDVLVTDYRLDSMNGIELVRAMHQLQPGLPSIIVSGYTEDFGVEGEETKVLRKPVSLELLVKTITNITVG